VTRRVGRVPFGTLKPGTRPVNWHLKVGRHRLKPGRYLINVRALRHGKVVAVARGQVIRVRRGA
jgi:hypothetical protein